MHTPHGFAELLLLLLIAVGAAAFFLRMKLPAVLGYLAVGIAAGPSALALVHDTEAVRSLAELGVVLLLFTIGLEFSLPALARMRGALLGLGGGEVGIAALATFGIAVWIGISVPGSIVLAGVVAMSSTALVTKQLTDQVELNAPHGRAALGVLLFQDLAVVPFLVVVSGLAGSTDGQIAMTLAEALGKGVVALAVILAVGRFLLGPALASVAALRSGELFTLAALTVALGAAWWTAALGLSPALGAFVAGMMLGESAYRHTIEAEIRPFRDVLLALFFVSVGMLLDLSVLPTGWPWILLLLSALVVFKLVLVLVLCRLARMPAESALRTALVLAHGGEFGFALLTLGLAEGLLRPDYGQVVLAALLLSMALAPLALRFNGAIAAFVVRRAEPIEARTAPTAPHGQSDHVLLVGFGRVGQHVARLLDEAGIAWHALDEDPVRVENARASGAPVSHGDGTRMDVLRAAGLERARGLALSMDDPQAAEPTVRAVREALPELPILVRARDDAHLDALQDAGATEVVPETLEAGLMVGSHLLLLLGIPSTDVAQRVRAVRHDRYSLLQALYPGAADRDPDALELRAVHVPHDARAIGRPLSALHLDDAGASAVALVRGEQRFDAPAADTTLAGGDVVVLSGTPAALDRGEASLVRG
jgi:CPA2 family monovalent cation:H+ antiporter-2